MALSAIPFQAFLPAVGAVALIGTGLRRSLARRAAEPRRARQPVQMPKELPAPPKRRVGPPEVSDLPTHACAGCGTPVPVSESHCRWCELKAGKPSQSRRTTLLHWALFLGGSALILGVGVLLQNA